MNSRKGICSKIPFFGPFSSLILLFTLEKKSIEVVMFDILTEESEVLPLGSICIRVYFRESDTFLEVLSQRIKQIVQVLPVKAIN